MNRIVRGIFAIVVFTGVACSTNVETHNQISSKDSLPEVMVKDVYMNYSDSGMLKMRLISDELINFEREEVKYTEFNKGIKVFFYNNKKEVESSLFSNQAYHNSKTDLWEYRGKVKIINLKGDTLKTNQLFADRKAERIYTDSLVVIKSIDNYVTEGSEGFESNLDFTDYTFKKFRSYYVE